MTQRPRTPMFDVLPPGKGTAKPQAENEPMPENVEEEYTPDSFLQKLASEKKETPPLGEPSFRPRIIRFLIIGAIGALALFVGAWGIAAAFSKATVTLVADRAFSPFSFGIDLSASVETPDWTAKRLPLQSLRKTMEQKKEYPATGEGEASASARGRVTLYNGLAAAQPLVVRTRLQAPDGKVFRLAAPVTIPANGSVGAEVIADQPGADYNIGPSRFTVPAFREQGLTERYEKIYAESQEPFRGGASGKTTIVRQDDIRGAQEELSRDVLDILGKEIREAVPEGFVLLDQGAMRLSVNSIAADAKVGDARESFAVTLNATVEALVFDERHISELARRELRNDELLEALPNASFDFAYTPAEPADFGRGSLRLTVDGSLNIAKSVDVAEIKQAVAGKRETEVQRELLTVPGIREARVTLWPFWIRRTPQSVERIEIRVE